MIVRMKKISVLTQTKDAETTLKALGEAGVLHIEHQNSPMSESVVKLEEKSRSLSKAIELLPNVKEEKNESIDYDKIISRIHKLISEKEVFTEDLKKISRNVKEWREWGEFAPELIEDLKNRGIWIQLCKITKNEANNIPKGVVLETLFKKGNISYCVVIAREETSLPFHTISLPQKSLKEMLIDEEREKEKIKNADKELTNIAKYKTALSVYQECLASIIEFNKVHSGMGKNERISYLIGYCPVYKVDVIEKLAEKEKWGLLVEDPGEGDNVPTLIKNPRWIEIIRPLFQMIKTVPGYREVDTSFWFLLFFSVFFGMLIGDAGYGLVFFIINLVCHIKFRHKLKDKSVFFLTYVLSLCAITWGVLTGTFFGQAYLAGKIEPLLPFLRSNRNVQSLCFFIGALHLSIAHVWRFIRKIPSLKVFSEVGWLCIIWGSYFLAKLLILGNDFPVFGKYLFIGGASLVVLFTNPTKNILKTIGSGVGDLLLNIINSFTDVVSYIRLFAVGVATVAVADAFNQIASGIGHGNILAGFLTAFVLLFGHTLNILLGAMAILVHGVRLNVLEFSSHLNMEFSGTEYVPFKSKGDIT